jgi:hypothetical protein
VLACPSPPALIFQASSALTALPVRSIHGPVQDEARRNLLLTSGSPSAAKARARIRGHALGRNHPSSFQLPGGRFDLGPWSITRRVLSGCWSLLSYLLQSDPTVLP